MDMNIHYSLDKGDNVFWICRNQMNENDEPIECDSIPISEEDYDELVNIQKFQPYMFPVFARLCYRIAELECQSGI